MPHANVFAVPGRGCEVMPVFSSGQSARQAPETYRAMRIDRPDLRLPAAAFSRIRRGPSRGRAKPASGVGSRHSRRAACGVRRRRTRSCAPRSISLQRDLAMKSSAVCTYYGDDFTGSTDVLEALAANGIFTVLFFGVPRRKASCALSRIAARSESPAKAGAAIHSGCRKICPSHSPSSRNSARPSISI
jgi:hypothetical protein